MADLSKLTDEELEILLTQKSASLENKGPKTLQDLSDDELSDLFKMKAEETVAGSESTLRGVAQGVSLGFADEIAGAVESTFTDKSYEQARDESRANFEIAKAANPTAFMTGEIAGGVGATILAGPASLGLRGAVGAGAIAGLGLSEEDEIENQLLDSLVGASLGVAGEGIGKALKYGGTRLKKSLIQGLYNEADSLALRGIGVTNKSGAKRLGKALQSKNITSSEFVDSLLNETDTSGKKLLSGFKTSEELLEDIVEKKQQIGEEMGGVLKSIDIEIGKPAIKPSELADRLDEEIIQPLLNDPAATDDMIRLGSQVQQRIDILRAKKSDWTMMDLHNWKVNTQNKVNFLKRENSDLALNSQLRKVVNSTNDFIHDKVDVLSTNPDALSTFKSLKNRYGILATAEDPIEDSIQAQADGLLGSVRKALGLAHVGGGATIAGGIMGGVPGAAVGAALTVASKSPKVNLALGKTLQKVGLALSKNPANEEYMQILMGAAARGSASFEGALQLVEKKIDGFITSPQEAEQWKTQVLNSGLQARQQMQLMNQINNGRVPQIENAQQQPAFFKTYEPRQRDENGRKIR